MAPLYIFFYFVDFLSPLPFTEGAQKEEPMQSVVLHNNHPVACSTIELLANTHRHWLLSDCLDFLLSKV